MAVTLSDPDRKHCTCLTASFPRARPRQLYWRRLVPHTPVVDPSFLLIHCSETKKVSERKFVPNVIEPSFGIGRIITGEGGLQIMICWRFARAAILWAFVLYVHHHVTSQKPTASTLRSPLSRPTDLSHLATQASWSMCFPRARVTSSALSCLSLPPSPPTRRSSCPLMRASTAPAPWRTSPQQ